MSVEEKEFVTNHSHYVAWLEYHQGWTRTGIIVSYVIAALICVSIIVGNIGESYYEEAQWAVWVLSAICSGYFLYALGRQKRFLRNVGLWRMGALRYSDMGKIGKILSKNA
ncbi:hypothetical protein [Vibrio barjaei]|uniref:hypothetical protein n=1 Tax=Vibrio barjaei TaxID=1676683 RepID=UPI0022851AC6|nr:hypothetical protein [Vibrio barjaei]MCY9873015.1 hypothetical protein [Vibrio barjaei]